MILLDTHTLIWLADDPGRLSDAARRVIAEDDEPAISPISVQEIAYLVLRGRLELDRPVGIWVHDALRTHEVQPVAQSVAIALRAGSLPAEFPGDPADRIIYATALELGVRLVTRDAEIAAYDPARAVW